MVVENLKELIPRQQFEVPIQAFIGSKAIARADIKAMRKNVLAKCYGGDVSRKRKQKNKRKVKNEKIEVLKFQEAFLAVLSMDEKN